MSQMTGKATASGPNMRTPNTLSHLSSRKKKSADYKPGKPIYLIGNPPPPKTPRTVERISVRAVHEEAIRALRHFATHGDNTFLSHLVNAISMPVPRKDLIRWCERYAQIKWKPHLRRFKGGRPKGEIMLREAEKSAFKPIPKRDSVVSSGIDVSLLWTVVVRFDTRCRVCGVPAILGEDTCYAHHNK